MNFRKISERGGGVISDLKNFIAIFLHLKQLFLSWISRKTSKKGGGHFRSEKFHCKFSAGATGLRKNRNEFFRKRGRGGGHSGPGCGRINLWKCTKNQAKPGNSSLNIAFHKTGMIFNESLKKIDFLPFLHFWLCQGLNGHFGLLGQNLALLPAWEAHATLLGQKRVFLVSCHLLEYKSWPKYRKCWFETNSTTSRLKLAHCAPPP